MSFADEPWAASRQLPQGTQNHREIVENCAFWASIALESERATMLIGWRGWSGGNTMPPVPMLNATALFYLSDC
jgi:hypothetical protein